MRRREVEQASEEVQRLAKALLQQGERLALAGLLEQAAEILAQAWDIARECDPKYANAAAWEIGGLRLQLRSYDEAARWFGRVSAFPARESRLWPILRQSLVQLCLERANGSLLQVPLYNLSVAQGDATPHSPTTSPLPRLRVVTLGQFQITRGDMVLPPCTTHKAIALFRHLLSRHHHLAHKDELLESLWPGADPRAAAHNLHVAASALRRYLDVPAGSYLLFETSHYLINPAARVEDDRQYFEQRIDEGERHWRASELGRAQVAYTEAIGCYQGDYYVDDHDGDWAMAEQQRLLARYLSALDHLGRMLIAGRQFEPAIECYQRLLERDGYREDAYCQIMRCYWQLGRRHEALSQYKRCAAILANDLGLEPMEETRSLYLAISGGSDGS